MQLFNMLTTNVVTKLEMVLPRGVNISVID